MLTWPFHSILAVLNLAPFGNKHRWSKPPKEGQLQHASSAGHNHAKIWAHCRTVHKTSVEYEVSTKNVSAQLKPIERWMCARLYFRTTVVHQATIEAGVLVDNCYFLQSSTKFGFSGLEFCGSTLQYEDEEHMSTKYWLVHRSISPISTHSDSPFAGVVSRHCDLEQHRKNKFFYRVTSTAHACYLK